MVLDWGKPPPAVLALSDFSLVTVEQILPNDMLGVRSDTNVSSTSEVRIEARTLFTVRRSDVRELAPRIEVLSQTPDVSWPRWKNPVCVTIPCMGEQHRVTLSEDGTVSLLDHGPEHVAMSAFTGKNPRCEKLRESLIECMTWGTQGYGIQDRRMLKKAMSLSSWFACKALEAFRFHSSDEGSVAGLAATIPWNSTDITQPDAELVKYAVDRCKQEAMRRGRLVALLCTQSQRYGVHYFAVIVLCDAVGHVRRMYAEFSEKQTVWAAKSAAATIASTLSLSALGTTDAAYWTFRDRYRPDPVSLWALLRLAEQCTSCTYDGSHVSQGVTELVKRSRSFKAPLPAICSHTCKRTSGNRVVTNPWWRRVHEEAGEDAVAVWGRRDRPADV